MLEDKEEKTIEDTIENAKKQIEEKGYESDLKMRGFTNITKSYMLLKAKK